jgi:hypothetical protein
MFTRLEGRHEHRYVIAYMALFLTVPGTALAVQKPNHNQRRSLSRGSGRSASTSCCTALAAFTVGAYYRPAGRWGCILRVGVAVRREADGQGWCDLGGSGGGSRRGTHVAHNPVTCRWHRGSEATLYVSASSTCDCPLANVG